MNRQQITPLLYAINRQDFEVCKFLVKDLEVDVNSFDQNKLCALVYAIQANNIRICHLLLNTTFESDLIENKSDRPKIAGRVKNTIIPFSLAPSKPTKRVANDENTSDFSEEEDMSEIADDYPMEMKHLFITFKISQILF